MKIVFCYYADVNYEARGAEELQCLSTMGEVSFVSIAAPKEKMENVYPITTPKRSFSQFVTIGMRTILRIKPDVLFLHDNYCALFIPFAKRFCPECKIVYDMSELYIGGHVKENHRFINWLLLDHQEYQHLREVDVVMAANEERAYVAMGYYALKELPIIFDNIHRIDEGFDFEYCRSKYDRFYKSDSFTLLYCGGLGSVAERDIEGLMQTVKKMGDSIQLLIAGQDDKDPRLYDLLNSSPNISYLGKLTRGELKYLYQKSDVNVVLFNPTMINTIYCASGKLYEGFFEGKPVLLSQNPPHERLCRDYGVGEVVQNKDYCTAIQRLREGQKNYIENVQKYVATIDYENRIKDLRRAITERLNRE